MSMSQLPERYPSFYIPHPQNEQQAVLVSLEEWFKQRSYHRVLALFGGAGVFFAAWYLFRRITARKSLSVGGSTSGLVKATKSSQSSVGIDDERCNTINANKDIVVPTGSPLDDRVIVHCCPRGFYVPSIATEPLKLETFLRVAGIPYEVSFCNEYDTPFLTYGGKTGHTYRECITILAEKFDVNLESNDVAPSRKTASHLVDISLESLFSWAILIWRWIYDEGKSLKKIHAVNTLGEEVMPDVAEKVKLATQFAQIGQLEKGEFVSTINQGIHDISAALGKHQYFQGQTPGSVDCHAFAILTQMMFNMPNSPFEVQIRKYENLVDFVRRMKDKYWPDWNQLILKPREFEEIYNSILMRQRHTRTSSSKTRKASKSREPIESIAEERMNVEPNKAQPKRTGVAAGGKQLADPVPVTTIPRKEAPRPPNPNLPAGILKGGVPSVGAALPNAGLVSASVGSTKFPTDQVHQPSPVATLAKVAAEKPLVQSSLPSQTRSKSPAPQQIKVDDSMAQGNKGSVKFNPGGNQQSQQSAKAPPQQQAQPQAGANGNYSTTSHAPVRNNRAPSEPPKRDTPQQQQQSENLHTQSYVHPDQYNNANVTKQQMAGMDEFHRAQSSSPFYHAPQHYTQSTYSVPPNFLAGQPMPGVVPNYPQQLHYPQVMNPSPGDSEGAQSPPPPFSHHHSLTPEQLQKAAMAAHMDMYFQQQRQQQYGSNTFHPNTSMVPPGFMPPQQPFDPRNPQALLRF